jgi:hypothetical protein
VEAFENFYVRHSCCVPELYAVSPVGGGGGGYFTTDRQSVSLCWCRAHSGTYDQILLPVEVLLSEICGLVSVGRPL